MLKQNLIENNNEHGDNRETTNLIIKEKGKTYDKNKLNEFLDNIQNCEDKIKLFYTLAYLILILFFTLLQIKFSVKNGEELRYYYFLLPAFSFTLAFSFSLNYFLKLKQLIEEKEEDELSNKNNRNYSMGNFLSYICLNFISFAICIFFVLLVLKLDNFLKDLSLSIVNIPLYISLGIVFFFFLFIFPAFLANKFYWGIILFTSYLVNIVVFLILLSIRIDQQTNLKYSKIFIPIYLAIIIQIIYSIYRMFVGIKSLLLKILETIALLGFLGTAIYFSYIKDNEDITQRYNISIIALISVIIFSLEKIIGLYYESDYSNE